jgi:hypothetical protein
MKNRTLIFVIIAIFAFIASSCKKEPTGNSLIGDDKKIDIKGTLMNGDMKNPNIEAGYWGKTVYVYFHEELGDCEVSISNSQGNVVFCDTIDTYPYASVRYYMGDQPLGRYHLTISDGTNEAEGWFNNFRLVVVQPH